MRAAKSMVGKMATAAVFAGMAGLLATTIGASFWIVAPPVAATVIAVVWRA